MATPPPPTGARLIEAAVPLARPYRTAGTHLTERRVLLVAVGSGAHTGWGECGPIPGYSAETLEQCRDWLADRLASLPAGGVTVPAAGPPAARFALETALADLDLRRRGVPLWRHLGGRGDPIPTGAVIGLGPEAHEVPRLAEALAAAGYHRIKLKVDREQGPLRVAAVREALPGHDLAVDANGSLDSSDPEAVAEYDRFGLSFIEQPFPAADLGAHARLAGMIETPICLDESVEGPASAARAINAGAGRVLNLKPARVGGLAAAVAVHDLAVEAGWAIWCGGMLETGIGKAAALAIAALPGMRLPADLPPSSRHFTTDLTDPPWDMEGGMIRLPAGPGLGVAPDPASLQHAIGWAADFGDDVGFPA